MNDRGRNVGKSGKKSNKNIVKRKSTTKVDLSTSEFEKLWSNNQEDRS